MIEVRYRDRVGNNLFQYCMGRILAEELKFKLNAKPIDGFDGTKAIVEGFSHDGPEVVYKKHDIDLEEVIKDKSDRKIILNGWFQKYKYYEPYADKIREWLFMPELPNILGISEKDLVVHIRLGDYFHKYKRTLRHEFYDKILAETEYDRLFICTDESENREYLGHFDQYNPVYYNGDPIDTIRFMKLFDKIILSMSTYCWWGAFLGKASKVFYPLTARDRGGYWGENTEIDLRINSDKYEYINNLKLTGDP